MKRYILYLFLFIFILSCAPEKNEMADLDKEKAAIVQVMKDYNKASEDKNFYAMVNTLASEVIFFGTDSSEIIKTFPEFKKQMLNQWKTFDKMKYGKMADISIQMDPNAKLASIIFGVPLEITIGVHKAKLFLRIARTLKKEKDKWVIVSGIVGNADPKQGVKLQELLNERANPQVTADSTNE